MRIIGCDLLPLASKRLAMLDTTTGEVVEVTLKHEGYGTCGSFILRFHARCEWVSKPRDRCSGF